MNKLQVPNYTLTDKLTEEQLNFFDKNGLIIFKKFITKETVDLFLKETQRIEKEWLDAGLDKVNGIPLKFGKDENDNKVIQRLCFVSQHSPALPGFLKNPLFKQLRNR